MTGRWHVWAWQSASSGTTCASGRGGSEGNCQPGTSAGWMFASWKHGSGIIWVCFSTFSETTYCNLFRETSFFGNVRAFIICNLGSHGNAEASPCLEHAWHRSKLFWRICKCHIFMVHFYNHMMRTQWSQKSKHISQLSWKLAPAKHSGHYLFDAYDITRSLACNPKISFFGVQLDAWLAMWHDVAGDEYWVLYISLPSAQNIDHTLW